MLKLFFVFFLFSFVSLVFAADNRAKDEAAIRDHIDKIFQAYMRKDRKTVEVMHSKNWRGFLTNSNTILRGIGAYMKEADGQSHFDQKRPGRLVDYEFLDYDIWFHGDAAIVNYVAELFWESEGAKGSYKLRSIDIYGKEDGEWNQVASNICRLPEDIASSISMAQPISAESRASLLKTREEVWRAFFTNDAEKLAKVIPSEAIAINPGEAEFSGQSSIFSAAKAFAGSGAKLVKLEFPVTEMQFYGATVIMYSNYVYELENGSKKEAYSGRASEIFVLRDDVWVNTGWHMDDGK